MAHVTIVVKKNVDWCLCGCIVDGMSTMNRLANTKNQYQSNRKKVLCVCSAGLLRSPTIAWVLSNEPYNCNTRAAGVVNEYALIPADEVLVEWADEIVCAEAEHLERIRYLLDARNTEKPVHVLGLPDVHEMRSPELVEAVKSSLAAVGFSGHN